MAIFKVSLHHNLKTHAIETDNYHDLYRLLFSAYVDNTNPTNKPIRITEFEFDGVQVKGLHGTWVTGLTIYELKEIIQNKTYMELVRIFSIIGSYHESYAYKEHESGYDCCHLIALIRDKIHLIKGVELFEGVSLSDAKNAYWEAVKKDILSKMVSFNTENPNQDDKNLLSIIEKNIDWVTVRKTHFAGLEAAIFGKYLLFVDKDCINSFEKL